MNRNEKPERLESPRNSKAEQKAENGSRNAPNQPPRFHDDFKHSFGFYWKLLRVYWFHLLLLLLTIITCSTLAIVHWNSVPKFTRCSYGVYMGWYLVGSVFAFLGVGLLMYWARRWSRQNPRPAVNLLGLSNALTLAMGTLGATLAHRSFNCVQAESLLGLWSWGVTVTITFFLSFFYSVYITILVHVPIVDPDNEGVWLLVYLRCLCWSPRLRRSLVLFPFVLLISVNVIAIVITRNANCDAPLKLLLYLSLAVFIVLFGLGFWKLFYCEQGNRVILYTILGCSLFGFACAILSTVWTKDSLECASNEPNLVLYRFAVVIKVLLYLASGTLFVLATCCKLESCLQILTSPKDHRFFQVETRRELSLARTEKKIVKDGDFYPVGDLESSLDNV